MTSLEYILTTMKLSVSDAQTSIERIERPNQLQPKSVTILMTPCSQTSIQRRRSSRKFNETISDDQLCQKSMEKRRFGKALSMTLVSYKLRRRKKLHEQW